MKKTNMLLGVLAVFTLLETSSPFVLAADVYWDINGATAGAGGTSPSGNWDTTTANWTTDSTGASTTAVWNNGNNAIFSAGTDAIGQFNVSVSGITVSNITQEEGRIQLNNGTLALAGATQTFNASTRVSGDYDLRINSMIADSGSGASAITKTGNGMLMLTGNNTFSGGVALNAGTLNFESSATAFGSGTLTLNGGNLAKTWGNSTTFANPISVTGPVTVGIVQGSASDMKFGGIWGAGSTSGNFNVANTSINGFGIQNASIKILGDISAYTGTISLNSLISQGGNRLRFGPETSGNFGMVGGSQVKFATSGSTSSSQTISVIDLGDNAYGTFRMGELSGTGGIVTVGWGAPSPTTFEVGALNTSTTFAGIIRDNVNGVGTGQAALTKVGTGTLILSVANFYSGGTVVSNGTLLVANTSGSGTGSGPVMVTNGAAFGGSGSASGSVSMAAGTILSPGTNSAIGNTLTCTANLTLAGVTNVFDLSSSAAGANDNVVVTGTLTIGGADTIKINPIIAGTLDISTDYTLFTAAAVTGSGTPALVWGTSTPSSPGTWSIVLSGNSVVLHYAPPVGQPPTVQATTFSPASPVYTGQSVMASATVVESSGATGLSYHWQSSANNSTWVNAPGSSTSATYTPSTLAAGATYYRLIATDSFGSTTNTSAALVVNNPTAPTVGTASYSPSGTVPAGTTVVFSSPVSPDDWVIGYQWQGSPDNSTWNNIFAATNSTYTNADVLASAYYRLVVTNRIGSAAGGSVQLAVSAGPNFFDLGTTAPTPGFGDSDISQLSTAGQSGSPDGMNYYVDNSSPPGQTFTTLTFSNGYQLTEVYVNGSTSGTFAGGQSTYNLRIYTVDSGNNATLVGSVLTSVNSGVQGASGHWYKFSGFAPITLIGNTNYAFTLQRNGGGWWELGNASGDLYSGGGSCLIPTAGGAFVGGPSTTYDAAFLVRLSQNINRLTITTNPVSLLLGPSGSGSFSVAATSDGNITGYQWYKGVSGDTTSPVSNGADANGTVFSGATTATLSFSSAGAGDNGYTYWCRVSGDYGGGMVANSSAATLGVYAPKSLSWMGVPADANWNTTSLDWSNTVTLASSVVFSSYDNVTLDDKGSGGTITIPGSIQPGSVTVNNSSQAYTLAGSGKITGTTGLTKTGNGTLTITATNDYAGNTTVSGGVLSISSSVGNVGTASVVGTSNFVLNGGALQFTSTGGTFTRGITLGASGGTSVVTSGNDLTVSGLFSGGGSLTKTGNGTLTLANANNTYTGNTILQGGSVILPAGEIQAFGPAFGTGGTVTLSNVTLFVKPNGGSDPYNNANSVYLGNSINVPVGTATVIDNSANNYANLWAGNNEVQWTGTGTVKFQNNSGVANPGLIWCGNPLSTFNGTLELGSATGNYAVYMGIGYSANNETVTDPFDASGTALVLGNTGRSLVQNISGSITTVKFGSIAGANTASELRGSHFEVGALNTDTTYAGQITGAGTSLTKVGTGTLTLSGANTYAGSTVVSAGGVVVTPLTTGGGDYTVADNATLGVALASGGSLNVSSLSLGNSTNNFIGVSSTTAPAINNSGALNLNGTVMVNVSGVIFVGQYPLIASSFISGTGGFVIGSLPNGVTANIGTNGTTIVLNVTTGSPAYVWAGLNNNSWDKTTANNWTANNSPALYQDGVFAQFDDTSARTNVNVAATVAPYAMLVTNDTRHYTITNTAGAKITGSGSLIKGGNGTLTLSGLNADFTGGVQINAGTIEVSGPTNLGTGVIQIAGGTLSVLQSYTSSSVLSVGPGSGSGNGMVNVASSKTFMVNSTIGNSGAGTGTLVKSGAGTLQLGGLSSYSGGTVVSNGTLTLATGGGMGAVRGALTVEPGATVSCMAVDALGYNGGQTATPVNVIGGTIDDATSGNQAYITTFNLTGGTMSSSGGGAYNFNGSQSGLNSLAANVVSTVSAPITLRANGLSVNTDQGTVPSGIDMVISGAISGGGNGFSKDGAGTLELTGANTYTGQTTVNNGILLVDGSGVIGSAVAVNGGNFGGTGTVNGAVTVNGGSLAPGGSSAIGTLTVNNNLTLAGNTLVRVQKGLAQSNDMVNVTGALTYGGTLTVSNLGPALVVGDSFRIFPSGGSGSFSSVVGTVGNGLAYSFNDGVLSVVSLTAEISSSVSGNTLNLTWPSGQGWRLESQTNSLSTGLSPTGWSAVTGISDGSATITIDPANPTVFYRLVNP